MMKALINARIYDYNQYQEQAYILFDEQITQVGPMIEFVDNGYDIIDCTGQLVMPSLVVGHSHIYSTFARGLSIPFNPQNFHEILAQLWWKLDASLDNSMNYYSGIASACDFLRNGITTIIDHHASGKDIIGSLLALKHAICDDASMRGIFCFETSDRFNIEACIKENVDFLSLEPTAFSAGMFGLHASMTLSETTLKAVKQVLKDEPIHIHVAESNEDETDSINQYGERIINRLDRHGLLNPGSIIAHALYTDSSELKILKKRGCVVALNVTSNMNNGVGLPNFEALRHSGVKIIIGNDGISSSITTEYLNLYYAAHLKNGINAFNLIDLCKMINDTYQYANDRLKIKLGKIQVGYAADLLTIPYHPVTPMDAENAFSHVFFGLYNSFKPSNVFVAGKRVVKEYQLRPELQSKYLDVIKAATRLWNEIKKG
ncbi:MAG: amidohydrolase family protein [Candidatus Izemoplasmatales bacterium]|jgi:cytosine/adenosine deaminase-related metal-dependent hydrolase